MNTNTENDASLTEDKPRLDLSIKVNETSACERHVTVSIPRSDIDRYFSGKFDELVPQAEVPGFRTGKAPRQLVENKFRDQVEDQVKGSLLMDALAQISDEESFSAIGEPDFDFESIGIPDDGPMTFEFNIEVRPEFDLPEWKGLKLTRTEQEIGDDDVNAEISRLVSRNADLVPVDEPAAEGDVLVANLTSRHDGKELQSASETMVEVRPVLNLGDATVEGFGKLVEGVNAGETRTTTVNVSNYAASEELQGAEVELEFEVLDVKRPEPVDVEQVAERLGLEDAGKLRELIRENLTNQQQYTQRQEIRKQITDLLTESANWDLPRDLLRRQSRREMDRALMELRSSGFAEKDILNQENLLRQDVMKRTETMLKEHFILERIAEAEGIEETDGDFELEIAKIAMQQNDSPRRIRARLERNGQMDALRNMIIEQKVLKQIEDSADIKSGKPKKKQDAEATAIDFFVAGERAGENIPEAKYDDAGEASLPATPAERD